MTDLIQEFQDNYKKYVSRIKEFQRFGYDIEYERNFIIESIEPISGEILEIGTGKGYLAIALAQKGYSFTTIDISSEDQSIAQMNAQYLGLDRQISFEIANAENLRYPNDCFNVCLTSNLMHHLEHPLKVINELLRITKKGGRIVISDFNQNGFEIIERIHSNDGRHHDSGHFTINEIVQYLAGKKVSVEKFFSSCHEMLVIQKWS